MERTSGQKRTIKQERAVRTRKEILEAAIKLFARKGLLATTMADLAKEIAMTPGALYWHFPTKEDLVLSALEELELRYKDAWKDLISEEGRKLSAADQMRGFFSRTQAFVRENRQYGMFLGLLAAESVELSERVATALRNTMNLFVYTLAGMIRYGQLKTQELRTDVDPLTLAQALIASHMGTVIFFNLYEKESSYDEMFKAIERVTHVGMERQGEKKNAP